MTAEQLTIDLGQTGQVSALLVRPQAARACYVLAHGAGAGMTHRFMEEVASGLADRDIATLRYQFPYMEKGSKRPDAPAVAHAAVRAAVEEAARRCVNLPLVAGGKSFGGRMTSQAQAIKPLPGVRGLVFLGFPLHPAGKPSTERAAHLSQILIPLLFVQGTQDKLAEPALIGPVVAALGSASRHDVEAADHSFHVPARSGRNDRAVMTEILDTVGAWVRAIVG
jgi:predicted alpha/beta-hydrolase family hydrolase